MGRTRTTGGRFAAKSAKVVPLGAVVQIETGKPTTFVLSHEGVESRKVECFHTGPELEAYQLQLRRMFAGEFGLDPAFVSVQ